MHAPFEAKALMIQWFTVPVKADVLPQEAVPSMCITVEGIEVYITKAQAMTFFNLKEA